ncbi:39S ribosomal protein L19, mitochondrial [Octopus bimaculoides]|uniref:39S ribosomal protein L19, mitochondrial n=1 Tax=Octopus bimaculoides TaxID=37653 RepID=UPI00071E6569|nr:39S ribosomal protein L19, mitochondrial [Octopus bimaculoides]|eukprot:XP_014771727.1 PREDICTED: 39S ribosomal protein L19, mitochondrial-like [Octopus bimaculoides]
MAQFLGQLIRIPCRNASRLHADPWRYSLKNEVVEGYRKSQLSKDQVKTDKKLPVQSDQVKVGEYRHVYPEFLPHPNWMARDRIREKLERSDMYKRRNVLHVPEFYVGSIMAVTVADQFAPLKKNRFVGICISRGGIGLKANFTLRNVIASQGIEIRYEIYQPHILNIEVLKLQKRLDDELFYLRDAPPEYSTVPFDFQPVSLPKGSEIPVDTTKVKLNPRPWLLRYERMDLKGVEDLNLPERFYVKAKKVAKPWEKYDLMKDYRENVNDTDASEVYSEFSEHSSHFKGLK